MTNYHNGHNGATTDHNFTQINILSRARGLVGCGVLAHFFQTADNTPTFLSDGKRFSDHSDTQMTENDNFNV